jgi:HD-like signal output (HDOD) protein
MTDNMTPGGGYDFSKLLSYDGASRSPLDPKGPESPIPLPSLGDIMYFSSSIPSFPAIATRALHLLADPDVELKELTTLINSDQGIAANVLKVANSPAFRGTAEITNIQLAVNRLGLNLVSQLLAVSSTRALFNPASRRIFEEYAPIWKRLWINSITSAFAGLWLAVNHLRDTTGNAFACCLLHDVGKTVVLHGIGALIDQTALTAPFNRDVVEFLLEDLHVDAGRKMALSWKLPTKVTEAIELHHEAKVPATKQLQTVFLVRLVSGLVEIRSNPKHRWALEEEVLESAKALELGYGYLDRIVEVIKEAADRAELICSTTS